MTQEGNILALEMTNDVRSEELALLCKVILRKGY
jgi:hypothetical protein